MSKGIIQTIAGGLLIAAGVLVEVFTLAAGSFLAGYLVAAGAGLLFTGIGTMLSGSGAQTNGFSSATRNPIAPWEVGYGRCRARGTIVDVSE